MAKTAMVIARVEPELKKDSEKVLKRLGMSITEAVNLFLSQVRIQKGLPFDVRIPNKTTLKAMKDANEGKNLTICKDVDDMFKKLGA
ncbi:MAG: type II toxin-antitoxin system RelB/DinJ family antitoxin [Deltaproteobacteria bacterium]|nr:type II toxin-antitoxin system RelB/DinJ family antitoxin [Deltaproteobacteria bacterium]